MTGKYSSYYFQVTGSINIAYIFYFLIKITFSGPKYNFCFQPTESPGRYWLWLPRTSTLPVLVLVLLSTIEKKTFELWAYVQNVLKIYIKGILPLELLFLYCFSNILWISLIAPISTRFKECEYASLIHWWMTCFQTEESELVLVTSSRAKEGGFFISTLPCPISTDISFSKIISSSDETEIQHTSSSCQDFFLKENTIKNPHINPYQNLQNPTKSSKSI